MKFLSFILNRKKIYEGTSILDFNLVRDSLSNNNIKYTYKVVNRNSSSIMDTSRARVGTFGENNDLSYNYYVYVHKNSYDEAIFIINKL
ncbi:MAG: hypothetical protein ACRC28_16920 [Clostridium sp.]|uniref:hypothetical protein n=1 Tax=Clostridium sp. TaxID=1506 RepID=UPI003F3B45C2